MITKDETLCLTVAINFTNGSEKTRIGVFFQKISHIAQMVSLCKMSIVFLTIL